MTLDWPPSEGLPGVDSKVAQSLRAMLREITNYIVKHAQAQIVCVALSSDAGTLLLAVEDDGASFDPATVVPGAGLRGLADRAARHGGTVDWSRGPDGRGMRFEIRLPAG